MPPPASTDYRSPRALLLLAVFMIVVIGVSALIGRIAEPDFWYRQLNKPWFNPPEWLFAPVWLVLYVLIAFAGWRTFLQEPDGQAMRLWYAQMVLNWLWPFVWFRAHLPWPAFAVIVMLWLAVSGFMAADRRGDRLSAWLFAPYLVWVSFAALLNLSIAIIN